VPFCRIFSLTVIFVIYFVKTQNNIVLQCVLVLFKLDQINVIIRESMYVINCVKMQQNVTSVDFVSRILSGLCTSKPYETYAFNISHCEYNINGILMCNVMAMLIGVDSTNPNVATVTSKLINVTHICNAQTTEWCKNKPPTNTRAHSCKPAGKSIRLKINKKRSRYRQRIASAEGSK